MPFSPGAHVPDVAAGAGIVALPAARRIGQKTRDRGIDLSGVFAKYTMSTARNLNLSSDGLLIITAGLAFGGGLTSVVSPAKLQNAADSMDRIGDEGVVIRVAFVLALLLTLITSAFIILLLKVKG